MILDHVEHLELDQEAANRYGNELRSLAYLAQGLRFLFDQVRRMEETVSEALDPKSKVLLYGNAPQLEQIPQGLVACSFHWYAVSACNYVRLVGWLGHGEDVRQARAYMKHVLPAVTRWRHKVAAHFARVDPHPSDSPADLTASVMFPLGFADDSFLTNPFTLARTVHGHGSTSRSDMQWSLTRTHRELARRYWPDERPHTMT